MQSALHTTCYGGSSTYIRYTLSTHTHIYMLHIHIFIYIMYVLHTLSTQETLGAQYFHILFIQSIHTYIPYIHPYVWGYRFSCTKGSGPRVLGLPGPGSGSRSRVPGSGSRVPGSGSGFGAPVAGLLVLVLLLLWWWLLWWLLLLLLLLLSSSS